MSPVGMDDSQLSVVEKEALGECFASAEARFEYEKARRLRRVLGLVGGLLVLVVFGVFMYWLGGGGRQPSATEETADGAGGPPAKPLGLEPIGSPMSKVQILAIVPEGTDCHSGVIKYIAEIAAKRPGQIRAEFTTMAEYGNKELEHRVGALCAAVLINGTPTVSVTRNGKPHIIRLVGTEPTHYTTADIGEALTAVFIEQYGDPGEPLFDSPAGTMGSAAAKPATKDPDAIELPGFREMKPPP